MILLLDIGNTRVKWALLRGVRLGRMRAVGAIGLGHGARGLYTADCGMPIAGF